MGAFLRRAQTWMVPIVLAAPCCMLACSLQDFGYLTRDPGGADSGSTESGGAEPDDSSADTTRDAPIGDVASAQDASDAGAVEEGGGGAVNLLVNAGFEQGYMGWSFTPTTAMGKYAYTQFPPTGGTDKDGQYELATWSGTDAFTVRIYQVVSDVPPGTYTFQGWFNRGVNNTAYIYASCGGANQQVDIPITGPTSWLLVSVTGITVTGGSCEVGFFVDASATDWLNADAFSLERTTPELADGGNAGDAGAGDAASDAGGE